MSNQPKKYFDQAFAARTYKVTHAEIGGPWLENEMTVRWVAEGLGFGEIIFYITSDGKFHCDAETMSREFVKGVLNKLVDSAEFDI